MKFGLKFVSLVILILVSAFLLCACAGESSPSDKKGTLEPLTTLGTTSEVVTNGNSSTTASSHTHVATATKGKEATCTEDGLTDGSICEICGEVLKEQEVIKAPGHVEEVLPGREATKTEDGYTEMVKCSVCDKTLVPRYQIPATGVWSGSVAKAFAGGTGTESDPYLISNGDQLALLAKSINESDNNAYYNKHYKLTDNIDLGGREWDPIGCNATGKNTYSASRIFCGVFDGNGFTVSNFKIRSPKKSYYYGFGLFGCISGATVKNLGVTDFMIDVTNKENIKNCAAGGISGVCSSKSVITDCYTKGTINAKTSVKDTNACAGGIVGTMGTAQITNCYTDVAVSAYIGAITNNNGRAYMGGIVGYASDASKSSESNIFNCASVGTVSSNPLCETYAGGIVGLLREYCNVKNCYSASDITAESSAFVYVGGIAGATFGKNSSIASCVYTGNAKAVSAKGKAYISDVVSYKPSNVQPVSCYRLKGVSIKASGNEPIYEISGAECELITLNSGDFYTSSLGWDTSVWELSSLNILDGKHPRMKAWN